MLLYYMSYSPQKCVDYVVKYFWPVAIGHCCMVYMLKAGLAGLSWIYYFYDIYMKWRCPDPFMAHQQDLIINVQKLQLKSLTVTLDEL